MEKLRKPYFLYLLLVTILGILVVFGGIWAIPTYERLPIYFLLFALATVAQFATTSVSLSAKAGITYQVSPAVIMATIPFFGPLGAATLDAAAAITLWLVKPSNKTTWKKSGEQLAFNTSMNSLATFIAGIAFLRIQNSFGANTFLGQTAPWLFAAIVSDQVNLWLLIGIIRLKQGREANPWQIWRENLWAMPLSILLMSIGGAILAFSINSFDWIGISIFFLPIFLSALAFQLYVRQMQQHMDNLENIVAERTQELSNVMKEKDQFLAVLTHDMKSPLTSIGIYGGLIRDYPQMILEKPHMAEVILRSQETLTGMVNNILDLEKLQADGTMQLEKEQIDLALLIEATVEPLRAQAGEKEINLSYEIESMPMVVEVDLSQIKRVIQNLISNAIKYTAKQGQVSLHVYRKDQFVIVTVEDTGYGIPEDELPYVFDRYRRVAKHKNVAAGTGLGLAITKAIVEAHDGHISVVSEEGKGSIFTIELPL